VLVPLLTIALPSVLVKVTSTLETASTPTFPIPKEREIFWPAATKPTTCWLSITKYGPSAGTTSISH